MVEAVKPYGDVSDFDRDSDLDKYIVKEHFQFAEVD